MFIVEVPSDVSGAGRSISGYGSCRYVLEEHELSHDTCKLGSVSIGKGVQNCKFGWSKLEVRIGWCVGSVQILRKINFPAFVEFWKIPNRNSWFREFYEPRVDKDGAVPRTLTLLVPFCCGIEEYWAATPPVGWSTNHLCRTAVKRCGDKTASAY